LIHVPYRGSTPALTDLIGGVHKLNREINAALADLMIKARLADLGGTALVLSLPTMGSSTLQKSRNGPRW
jgi:hypothetical protein